MPTETQQGTAVERPGLLAVLLAITLLSACDGGIFGTGSGSEVDVIDPGAISQGGTTGEADTSMTDGDDAGGATGGGLEGGAGDDGGGQTDGAATQPPGTAVDMTTPTEVSALEFTNTLAGGDTSEPRIRLINTTDLALRLFHDDSRARRLLTRSSPGDAGGYVNVPVTIEGLAVARVAANDASDETLADTDVLFRIAPLELGVASVSSLVVSARGTDSDFVVTALATMTRSDDAAQALVRIVPTIRLANDDEASETAFQLTPSGESPGGVEVTFAATNADNPSSTYLAVPAGDYRLSSSDARIDERALSIEAGTVYTLLVTGRDSLLVIIDGSDGRSGQ